MRTSREMPRVRVRFIEESPLRFRISNFEFRIGQRRRGKDNVVTPHPPHSQFAIRNSQSSQRLDRVELGGAARGLDAEDGPTTEEKSAA